MTRVSNLIEFPFNWFPLREGSYQDGKLNVSSEELEVSIQLVSPARGETPTTNSPVSVAVTGFHSIGFPCERGDRKSCLGQDSGLLVSIQLVSPARGEIDKGIVLHYG